MTGWWERVERFLSTDRRDVGCDEAVAVLHVYVELLAAGRDAAERYPGVASHLAACGSCGEDAYGLLAAVQADDLHIQGPASASVQRPEDIPGVRAQLPSMSQRHR
jgi:hypothetical protein